MPALQPPPPRQPLCLSFLGALPSPLPTEVSELPAHPKPQTRFLRAWEARAAPAQPPGEGNCRQMFGAQLWEGLGAKRDLHVPLELLGPAPTEP